MNEFNIEAFSIIAILILEAFIIIAIAIKKRNPESSVNSSQCSKLWERIVGWIFDIIICALMFYCIYKIARFYRIPIPEPVEELLYFVVFWLYFALLESSVFQATLGKFAEGIIVTDLNGNKISFLKASIRFFMRIISFGPPFLGLLLVFFTKYKQTFHDIVTNTIVVIKYDIESYNRSFQKDG